MKKINVNLNIAQAAFVQTLQQGVNQIFLEWGRGAGKSTVLGYAINLAANELRQATGVLVGQTYQQILSRTLPSTKQGLAMFGLFEGVDYVVGWGGKKLGFAMPLQAPNAWKNVIHFRSGFILVLVGLDNSNSGRGINSSIVIGDEAALLNPEKLFNNVQTTNRVRNALFSKSTLCNAEIYASSTPMTQEGRWFTKMEEKIIGARKGLVDLPSPERYAFIKANAYCNQSNLSKDWFARMKANTPSIAHYNAEILNIRPTLIENSFYPSLNPSTHYYEAYNNSYLEELSSTYTPSSFNCKQDGDLDRTAPLILEMDWGVFNSLVVLQDNKEEVRHLKSMWVISPQIIDDLMNDFHDYYSSHGNKRIYFYYDRNGNSRVANSKLTFAQQATEILRRKGWTVIPKTEGHLDPPHNEKFVVVDYLLKHGGTKGLPLVQINKHNCRDLTISLENAPAKEGNNGIQKDKLSERSKVLPQQEATHLSDAFDLYLYWKYKDKVKRLLEGGRGDQSIPLFRK